MSPRNIHMPFGFEQGDPVIVCRNELHMVIVQEALQMRAYYCLAGSMIAGRRFGCAIIFHQGQLSETGVDRYHRWLTESISTHLAPGGKIHYV